MTTKFRCNWEMLATVVGADPFVARGQSTTTAPAGKFPPPFANRTWFTFTPPGKTFSGKPATEVVWVVVVEIAPKDPATDVQSPVLSPCVGDRTGVAVMVRKQLLSGCRNEQKTLLENVIRNNIKVKKIIYVSRNFDLVVRWFS